MKNQLTAFTQLQEEVFKIHQSHKQKFEETKELVLKVNINDKSVINAHHYYVRQVLN